MAGENVDNSFGFLPIDSDGKEHRVEHYAKKTGTAMYKGDPVKRNADGEVELAATGDRLAGVCAGNAAAADDSVMVWDDKDQEYMAQCDATYAAADVGLNAAMTINAADAALGRGKSELLVSSFAITATLPWKITGLKERYENVVGEFAIVKCKMNQHDSSDGTAGI